MHQGVSNLTGQPHTQSGWCAYGASRLMPGSGLPGPCGRFHSPGADVACAAQHVQHALIMRHWLQGSLQAHSLALMASVSAPQGNRLTPQSQQPTRRLSSRTADTHLPHLPCGKQHCSAGHSGGPGWSPAAQPHAPLEQQRCTQSWQLRLCCCWGRLRRVLCRLLLELLLQARRSGPPAWPLGCQQHCGRVAVLGWPPHWQPAGAAAGAFSKQQLPVAVPSRFCSQGKRAEPVVRCHCCS